MHRTRLRTLAALAGIRPHYGPARRDNGDGAGSGSADGGGGSGTTDNGSTSDSTDDGGTGQGDGDTGKKPEIKGDFNPERHARSLKAARDGEAKAKAEAKAAKERTDAILKAAGLTPDGKEDPAEQLKAAREAADKSTAKARQTAVELAVYKSAGKAGADPDAVLDSRGFLAEVADLDPESADFGDKVAAAIKAAVKKNTKLAAGTAGQGSGATRQGTDHTGGTSGRSRSTSLDAAVKRKLGG